MTWLCLCMTLVVVFSTYKPVMRATYDLRKFSADTGLYTATTAYSHFDENSGTINVTANPSLPSRIAHFDIEDTKYVSAMRGVQTCVPLSFGYSLMEGNLLFPPYKYPACSSLLTETPPELDMNVTTGNFSMSCPALSHMSYVKNPPGLLPNGQYTYDDLAEKWVISSGRPGEMQLDDSEFVYGSCGEKFTEAVNLPRVNSSAYNRAKRIMEQRRVTEKPLTILLLTIDSFSRRHFYRKLNETVKLLNAIRDEGQFGVYDFKLNNVQGGNSIENMGSIFGDFIPKELEDPPYEDRLGPTSLWHILKDLGYVTLIGQENCDYRFPGSLGRVLEVDHLVRNFYCAYTLLFKRTMSKDELVQRCIGSHMSHYFTLNYTLNFMQMYQGLNQFIYLHIDTAHEATGQHAATLDPDLTEFLPRYLNWSQESGQDLVVFLQADHGMRYGRWFKDVSAVQELKLPSLFILAPKTLLARIPGSEEHLWTNTFRLTTKPDLRASILGLGLLPYGDTYPVHADHYLDKSVDLFREDSPITRTCESAGIPVWYCSCLLLEPIDISAGGLTSNHFSDLVTAVSEYALYIINRETHSSPYLPEGYLCEKLTLESIGKPSGLNIGRSLELIRVELYVKQHKNVKFEVLAVVGAQFKSDLMRLEWDRYELLPFIYNGYQASIRIVGIERKDSYAGQCEAVSRVRSVRAEFCVCKDLDELRQDSPGLWE